MDGMLSQDEINALLNGMDLSGNMDSSDESSFSSEYTTAVEEAAADSEEQLNDMEKDAIGEVANISMTTCLLLLLLLSRFSRVRLLATQWTAAHQAPPPMGFSRQEDWSGHHCLL